MVPVKNESRRRRSVAGMTLIEVMVVVAIIGILAAVAIPVFSNYAKESRMSEATANIQGILEAEEAYFARYHRYTQGLGICPPVPPADAGSNQKWPANVATDCNAPPGSGLGWTMLGWEPDGPVYFQYQVFSLYDPAGEKVNLPSAVLPAGGWGVDWATELGNVAADMQPWCAVQASADTDGDTDFVFFRGNSYNNKIFRSPDDEY
jgi:prepilin-type N-terminal cleavage/methylation domain-containing protein